MGRIVLTANEIEAVLTVAGDADEHETIKSTSESDIEAAKTMAAFESGMDKLRAMLTRRSRKLQDYQP